MSDRAIITGIILSVVLLILVSAAGARAAGTYCPNPAHARPHKAPAQLVPRVARTFHIDRAAVNDAAFVRCDGATLLGCFIGANLVCGKADTRRTLPGASAWCRAHPGSRFIPMFATGHATIYDWTCAGTRAVAGKIVQPVDAQGYIAGNWKRIR